MKLVNLPKSFLDNVGGVKGISELIEDCGFDSDRIFFSYVKRSNKKVGVIFSLLKGEEIFTGVSKCHTEDTFSKAEGFRIAILNALENNTNYPESFKKDIDKHSKRVIRYFFGDKKDPEPVEDVVSFEDLTSLLADVFVPKKRNGKGCGPKDGSGPRKCKETKKSFIDDLKEKVSKNPFLESIFNGKSIFSDVEDEIVEDIDEAVEAATNLVDVLSNLVKETVDETVDEYIPTEEDEKLLDTIFVYADKVGMVIENLVDDLYLAEGFTSAFIGIVHDKKGNTINVLYDGNAVRKLIGDVDEFDSFVDEMNSLSCGPRFI